MQGPPPAFAARAVMRDGLDEILKARELLRGVAVYTPMEESRWLSGACGGPVYLKAENLQRTGSFKIRGAYVRMSRLSIDERERGVVAASAGNHAQGVALAAKMLGVDATIFMPNGAPLPKERATRGYGATVRHFGATLDEAIGAATSFAESEGATFIHPFDHLDIVRGHGTCGLEILEQCPEVRTVLVSTGGGGLVAGIATAIRLQRPDVKIVAVQAEGAAAYPGSLAAGKPVPLQSMATMADGIAVGCPGDIPFTAIRQLVDDVVLVGEEDISRALLQLLERAKLVVEPAGAAATAALLRYANRFETPAVAVLSGGNVDPLLLSKLIRHGLAAAGRYLFLQVTVPDLPGGLARLLTELAEVQANVLDVMHERITADLPLDAVAVAIQLETRGASHSERVLERLKARGYEVKLGNRPISVS